MTEQKSPAIPQIDVGAWINEDEPKESIASTWDSAFRHSGLVYLTNHGIAPLYHRVAEEWKQFCALPASKKEKFSSSAYGACGYSSIGKEAVALSKLEENKTSKNSVLADPVESLVNGFSDTFDGAFPRLENGYMRGDKLRDSCMELYQTLDKRVIRPCLAIASVALGIDEDCFENRWFAEGPGAYQLRLAMYSPRNDDNVDEETKKEILYGEHTDYDGLTFLWRNRTNGLEAFIDDAWHEVPVLEGHPDALVVNLGDLMEFWTRGYWHSPLHRVLRNRSEAAQGDMSNRKAADQEDTSSGSEVAQNDTSRLVSIVFFAGPHKETKLLPLPSGKLKPSEQDGGQVITAGQHVQNKIAKTNQ